jgi:hypothetical protein
MENLPQKDIYNQEQLLDLAEWVTGDHPRDSEAANALRAFAMIVKVLEQKYVDMGLCIEGPTLKNTYSAVMFDGEKTMTVEGDTPLAAILDLSRKINNES